MTRIKLSISIKPTRNPELSNQKKVVSRKSSRGRQSNTGDMQKQRVREGDRIKKARIQLPSVGPGGQLAEVRRKKSHQLVRQR